MQTGPMAKLNVRPF